MHIIQEEIGLPKIVEDKTSDFISVFTISPLPSGYGITLGNALRRVMLSTLPGAAVTGIKIKGVTHEYATLKGVKDSVLDITLNLKRVHLRKTSSEPTMIKLKVSKAGIVTAKDLDVPSDVEVLNPDQYITAIDKGGSIEAELRVEKGVGYVPVQLRKNKDKDAQIIDIDAIYSPILHIKYDVEATRVGQMTNLDKLVMEVETNGSISPEEAIKFAANVLKSYYDIFDLEEIPVQAEFMSDVASIQAKAAEEESKKPTQEAYTPIEILGLSPRTLNSLINGGIGSIEQLEKCTESKLSNLRGFGKKALNEVADALATRDTKLSDE